jgi:hypothetical protein
MKAWADIMTDPNRSVCETSYSKFYIDKGCKIEKFNDGHIEIKNVMGSDVKYKDVTDKQFEIFEEFGWDIGATTVCIDTYTLSVERLNKYIRAATNKNRMQELEEFKGRRDALLNKIYQYNCRLNKLFVDL